MRQRFNRPSLGWPAFAMAGPLPGPAPYDDVGPRGYHHGFAMSAEGRGRRRRGPGAWGGPPWGAGWPGPGRGPRARRGDVRVAVLTLLAEEPMHGYQIIQELDARSGGRWRPSPGSVYPTLQLLEDEGLVTVEQREGKKVFAITDAGRAILAERAGVPPWEDLDDEGEVFATLREAAFQLGAAVMQVAHAGTDSQRQRVLNLLIDARKKVYGILAEDEPDVQA